MLDGDSLPRVPLKLASSPDDLVEVEQTKCRFEISLSKFLGDREPSDDDEEADLWLVSKLVPRDSPCFLAGDPKVGKTWIALDLAISVAMGEPWLGRFEVEKSRVLVLTLEDSQAIVRQRLWQLARSRELDPHDLDGWLAVDAEGPFYFDDSESLKTMTRTLEDFRPDLVIVDSLARSFRGDENSKKDVGEFTRPWTRLCREHETAVIVIHHNTKSASGGPGKKLRGSGDLFATARQVIGVTATKVDGICEVASEGNYGNVASFRLERREELTPDEKKAVSLIYRELGDEPKQSKIDDEICRLLAQAQLGTKELRSKVPGRSQTVSARINVLAVQGRITRSGARGPWKLAQESEE